MGLFGLFNKKEKSSGYSVETLLIGYLATETSKLLGHPVGSKKFDDACAALGKALESTFIPLLDKGLQQQAYDAIGEVCPNRSNEAFGQYLLLLYVRFGVIQGAIASGKVKPEEASTRIITEALLKQMKSVIAQFKAG